MVTYLLSKKCLNSGEVWSYCFLQHNYHNYYHNTIVIFITINTNINCKNNFCHIIPGSLITPTFLEWTSLKAASPIPLLIQIQGLLISRKCWLWVNSAWHILIYDVVSMELNNEVSSGPNCKKVLLKAVMNGREKLKLFLYD